MNRAARIMLSTFGAFTGAMGVEHGLGEILQGNTRPAHLMIQSWPDSDFFRVLSGEPAMTVIPNLLLTGILAVLFSLVYIGWAVLLVQHRHGGLVLILLCIPMLLFGAGLFPPVFGGLIGAAAAVLPDRPAWGRTHLSIRVRRLLGSLWPWLFGACLLSWLGMFPGVPVLSTWFGVESPALIFVFLAGMFGFLILSSLASIARDSQGWSATP